MSAVNRVDPCATIRFLLRNSVPPSAIGRHWAQETDSRDARS